MTLDAKVRNLISFLLELREPALSPKPYALAALTLPPPKEVTDDGEPDLTENTVLDPFGRCLTSGGAWHTVHVRVQGLQAWIKRNSTPCDSLKSTLGRA